MLVSSFVYPEILNSKNKILKVRISNWNIFRIEYAKIMYSAYGASMLSADKMSQKFENIKEAKRQPTYRHLI